MTELEGAMPRGKDLVHLCMKWEITDVEELGGKVLKYLKIECTNCDGYKYCRRLSNGYTNPVNHYASCVGSKESLEEVVSRHRHLAQENKDRDEGDKVSVGAHHFTVVSDAQRSTHMWLTLITLKNMAIGDVECPIQRASVKHVATKSSKTVMDAGPHLLTEIVEEKISVMMKLTVGGQILFDGCTLNGGVHYIALFASFGVPYNTKTPSGDVKRHRHKVRLLAVAPLPPIDADDDMDESAVFNAEAHINFFKKPLN
jgi:hypothetical protein